ncbi:MAG TPA: hypothetical protein VKP08_10105 [Anaerolineales bacterium]|nr:hypothetical protein [Anaerolineales bacterium]
MNTNEDNKLLFASETAVFRIVSLAKIMSWFMLAVYLIIFLVNNLMPLFQGQRLPTEFSQLLLSIVDLLYTPMMGVFYFLILQGVAHGLNLGLDIYYDFQPEEDEEAVDEEA